MILEKEIWKEIDGYEGIYQISNYGNVKSLQRSVLGEFGFRNLKERKLKLFNSYQGYKRVTLNYGEKQKHFFVHRLVGFAFISNPNKKPFINHVNGVRGDNFYKNLEWCTQSENEIHARNILGKKTLCGENIGNAVLKNEDIIAIRSSSFTCKELAKKFNTHFGNISSIKTGKTWKHLLQEKK